MTVEDFDKLRTELRTVNSNYTLAKKTLIKIAIKEVFNLDLDLELVPGQI
jgi:ribosomal protein L10